MNRAIDGDVVVVALLPVEEWEGEGGMLVKEGEEGGEEEGGVGIAEVRVWGVGEVSVCVTCKSHMQMHHSVSPHTYLMYTPTACVHTYTYTHTITHPRHTHV